MVRPPYIQFRQRRRLGYPKATACALAICELDQMFAREPCL